MRIILLDMDSRDEIDVFKIFEMLAESDDYSKEMRILTGKDYAQDKWDNFNEMLEEYIIEEGMPYDGHLIIIDTEEKTVERTKFKVDIKEEKTEIIDIEKTVTIG